MNCLDCKNKYLLIPVITFAAFTPMLTSTSLAGPVYSKAVEYFNPSDSSLSPAIQTPDFILLGEGKDAQRVAMANAYNHIITAAVDEIGMTKNEIQALATKIVHTSDLSAQTQFFLEIARRIKELSNYYEKVDLKDVLVRISEDQDVNTVALRADLFTQEAKLMENAYKTYNDEYKRKTHELNEKVKYIKSKYSEYQCKDTATNSHLSVSDLTVENINNYESCTFTYDYLNQEVKSCISLKKDSDFADTSATAVLQNTEILATTLSLEQYANFKDVRENLLTQNRTKECDPNEKLTPSEIFNYARQVATDPHHLTLRTFVTSFNNSCLRQNISPKQAAELALDGLTVVKNLNLPHASCNQNDSRYEAKYENKSTHREEEKQPKSERLDSVQSTSHDQDSKNEVLHEVQPSSSSYYKDSKGESKKARSLRSRSWSLGSRESDLRSHTSLDSLASLEIRMIRDLNETDTRNLQQNSDFHIVTNDDLKNENSK